MLQDAGTILLNHNLGDAVLAELAAFNAGFAVIKQTILNGKDITSALGSLSTMLGQMKTLEPEVTTKRVTSGRRLLVKAITIWKSSLPSTVLKNSAKNWIHGSPVCQF